MAELEPRELDLLEDNLETLEQCDDLASLELSDPLTERLGAYRDVLDLCREAFPSETPPEDLLAEVLAEAREVSRRPQLAAAGVADASGWRSFWDRWRGTLIPGVALAATAMAMLWVLEPKTQLAALNPDLSGEHEAGDPNEADLDEPSNSDAAASDAAADTAANPAKTDDVPPPTAPPASEDTEPPEPASENTEDHLPRPDPKSGGQRPAPDAIGIIEAVPDAPVLDSLDSLDPLDPLDPLDKDETWAALTRANSARLDGHCDRARPLYSEVIAAGSNTQAAARAHAGMGLCLEREQADPSDWFEQARALSPSVDAWIEQQRDEQVMPSKPANKKQSKKTTNNKNTFEDFSQAL